MNDKNGETEKKYAEPVVIAEVGCNHQGNFEFAKQMIEKIAEINQSFTAESDAYSEETVRYSNIQPRISVVKFQKRTPKILLTEEEYNAPHPEPGNSFGETYGLHREALEFSVEQHAKLKNFCEENNLIYSVSVWDLPAAEEIVTLTPQMIKIPAASNLDFELLEFLRENYSGEIHISLGMTTFEEEQKIIEFFKQKDRLKDIVLYACTSCYPCNAENSCILEIARINDSYKGEIRGIGFSGHHTGTNLDTAAYTLGAKYIERHFTLDKTLKGTDQCLSLEPDELKQLALNLYQVRLALQYKPHEILNCELPSFNKLKRMKEKTL